MTLIGISGCTALLLTGFGIKDSISKILDLQFKEIQTYDSMLILNTEQKPVERVVDTAFAKMKNLVDADTVIGKPVSLGDGTSVIPISRVTLGMLTGGGEYGGAECRSDYPFAGGSGAVVSLKPAGFLLDDGKTCRYIHAGEDPIDNLIEKTSDFLNSFQHKN